MPPPPAQPISTSGAAAEEASARGAGAGGAVLVALAGGLGALHVALFVATAIARLAHPFELEWMEGGVVDHVARVLEGRGLYVPPTVDYVPFVYTPGYYYASAAAAKILGLGFLAPRLVSLASALGAAAIIGALVRREGGGWSAVALSAGLFLGADRWLGGWLDLARVDALFLFAFLAAVYAARRWPRSRGLVAAAALLWVAFTVKQTALGMSLPLLAFFAWRDRLRGLIAALALAAAVGVTVAVANGRSDGWFAYFVFTLPASHELRAHMLAPFFTTDLLLHVPVALVLAALGARALPDPEGRRFYAALAVALGGAALFMRLHRGGWENTLLPAYAAIALGAGLGMSALLRRRSAPSSRAAVVGAAAAVQLLMLAYRPGSLLPAPGAEAAARAVVARLSSIDGAVFVPSHGYIAALAGKRPTAHAMGVRDVLRGEGAPAHGLRVSLQSAFRSRAFAAVLADDSDAATWQALGLTSSYQLEPASDPLSPLSPVSPLLAPAFAPATGWRAPVPRLLVPRP